MRQKFRWASLILLLNVAPAVALGAITYGAARTGAAGGRGWLEGLGGRPVRAGRPVAPKKAPGTQPCGGPRVAGAALRRPRGATFGLTAVPVSSTEVGLAWNVSSTEETPLVIRRSFTGTDDWATVAVLPAGSSVWTDVSLYPSRTYWYYVTAAGALGGSPPTAPASAKTASAVRYAPGAPIAGVTSQLRDPESLTVDADSATTATVNFTDPNPGSNRDYAVERSSDGGFTYSVIGTCGYAQGGPYQDSALAPSRVYWYRVRGLSTAGNVTNYTPPAAVRMPVRLPGRPIEPAGTRVVNEGATTNRVTWEDTNGRAATYRIYRCPWAYSRPYAYTLVGTAAAGVASYTDSAATAESCYGYRVVAVSGAGRSDPDQTVFVDTASPGGAHTYDIGPGQPYGRLGELDWSTLGPGDDVRIHAEGAGPYHELVLLSARGTRERPITIEGVPGARGALPVLDGTDAVQDRQFTYNYRAYGGVGAITTYKRPGQRSGFRPGYLIIKNLEIRNVYQGDGGGNTFTDYAGTRQTYTAGAKGVYLLTGDNITIKGCNIHGNGEGVFGAGQNDQDRYMENVILRGNFLWGNGTLGKWGQHNSYLECIHPLYEYNRYGPVRPGALGGSLKDRGVGTVVRYNYIRASAQIIDLPEAQNEGDLALADPGYHETFVYGNVLVDDNPLCGKFIHYGGDQGNPWWQRKGVLYFWNNTCLCTLPQTGPGSIYAVQVVDLQTPGESVDARNNIVHFAAPHDRNPPDLALAPAWGRGYFGRNWVDAGWHRSPQGSAVTGSITGTERLITGKDPGFVCPPADLRLAHGSPCIGRAGSVSRALSAYPLDHQYEPPVPPSVLPAGRARAAATSLGAHEYQR